tara:strand:- start:12771 stop:13694 length:924 start_codon:yes stop_codon:yes gene_type:complete
MLHDVETMLFVPGLPRCATTAFVNVLSQHSAVEVGVQKEPHYYLPMDLKKKLFAFETKSGRVMKKAFYKLGFCYNYEEYQENFRNAADVLIDGSTLYSLYPESFENIKNDFGDVKTCKFIFFMRGNSLKRAISHYKFSVSRGEEYRSFDDAIRTELSSGLENWILNGYVKGGDVTEAFSRVEKLFGLENVLLVDIEKVAIFSNEFMLLVLEFLGVEEYEFDFDVYSNGSEEIANPIFKKIRVFMRVLRQINPRFFDNSLTRFIFNGFISNVKKIEPVPVEVSEEILNVFENVDSKNRDLYVNKGVQL